MRLSLFAISLLSFVLAFSSSPSDAQEGLGRLDADSVRANRPQRAANIEHPSGEPVWYFQLPGGACRNPDCQNDRERSELIQSSADNLIGTEYRYTFSVYFPPDMPDVSPTNLIFWQIKPHGSGKPSVTMELVGNTINFVLSDPTQVQGDPMNPLRPAVIRTVTTSARGQWLDFVLDARWSMSGDGYIRLSLDGRQVVSHTGPNVDANSSRQRVRFGLYRSFLSRYMQARGVGELPLQTALFSNITRSIIQ